MEPVTLRTPRLVLSPQTTEDADQIVACCQDPDVIAFTPIPVPYGRDEAESFVRQVEAGWRDGTRFEFAVRPRADPTNVLGAVSIFGVADGAGEVGYLLAPAGRGHDFMTEAVSAILDWAFAGPPDGLGLSRVQWHALPENEASALVAQRCGFRLEGRLRSALTHRGTRRDQLLAAVLRTDDRRQPIRWDDGQQ
ncbi:GNAT family protein [Curtobacterium sp. MCBD17_003]|uniref:GNAT family N-acetyltransferase n=1 Tax=Curtobacterium sp. MCBD17_003 TaxID=2175667 RepID=UPI000DA70A6B|nr:GNAT family protein [Curtobacterium sp. MCBD17_003]WIE56069.1 GNAT family protein [Curtobacterium sp. MCBD17_003]